MTKLQILNKHIDFSKDGVIYRTDALQAMQEYADQQLILHGVGCCGCLTREDLNPDFLKIIDDIEDKIRR